MTLVKCWMSTNLITVKPTDSVITAKLLLKEVLADADSKENLYFEFELK